MGVTLICQGRDLGVSGLVPDGMQRGGGRWLAGWLAALEMDGRGEERHAALAALLLMVFVAGRLLSRFETSGGTPSRPIEEASHCPPQTA